MSTTQAAVAVELPTRPEALALWQVLNGKV